MDSVVCLWTLHLAGPTCILACATVPATSLFGSVALTLCDGFAAGLHGVEGGGIDVDDLCNCSGGDNGPEDEVGEVHICAQMRRNV
jgi:hypothetical protein